MWDQPVLYYSLLELHAGSAHAHKQPAGAGHEPEPVCEWGAVQLAFRRPTNIRSIGFPCGLVFAAAGLLSLRLVTAIARSGHLGTRGGSSSMYAPPRSR